MIVNEETSKTDSTRNEAAENDHEKTNSVIEIKPGTKCDKPDLFYIDACTPLNAIALQYDSSDSEDENSKNNAEQVPNTQDYRNKTVDISSNEESADSESDSSSSDSESDSKSSDSKSKSSDSDSDNESKNYKKTRRNKVKRNFPIKSEFDDLPPIEDLKISVPEVLCDPLGEVAWTVEQMVVVRPKPGKPTLNIDTVLFIEKGQRALGHIFDVFGQVAEPHYCVRFNSSEHIQESDVKVGMTVYYCPNTQYTSLVFLAQLTMMKAIDDVGEDEPPQFSDDEEERAYLASLKNKGNNDKGKESNNEITPSKRKRGNKTSWQSNHPWNSNRDNEHNFSPQNPKPFYRSHHPWSNRRFQQQNPWYQYHNSFPNHRWMAPYPPYNQMQGYNQYTGPTQAQHTEMQNVSAPHMHWNSNYELPQMDATPLQGFTQTMVPPFTLPPPPPPPPPSTDT